jgi:hypothetical protein
MIEAGPYRLPMALFNFLEYRKVYTVATLPANPRTGTTVRVSNLTSPTVGSAPVAGGSANALCWYNGSAWRVYAV